MVSKASDDLPEPDRPVNTTSLSRGIVEVDVLEIVLARAADHDGPPAEQSFDGLDGLGGPHRARCRFGSGHGGVLEAGFLNGNALRLARIGLARASASSVRTKEERGQRRIVSAPGPRG